MLKLTKIVAAVLAVAFMTTGCNTMSGAGKDVQSVGQSLENSADKHKPKP
jgi:entericidin B